MPKKETPSKTKKKTPNKKKPAVVEIVEEQKPRKKSGPKERLNEDIIQKFSDLVKAGNYESTAAQLLGFDPSTICKWKNKGTDDEEKGQTNTIYYKFLLATRESSAYSEAWHLQQIRKAGESGNWQASAWYLERKYPDKWGNKYMLELKKLHIMEAKLELEKATAVNREVEESDDSFIEALNATAEVVWSDDEPQEEER